MRRLLFSGSTLLLAFTLASTAVSAQDGRGHKLGEYDEIIIKRKGETQNAKVTVEIKDGEVFVDGKPIREYEGDGLSVKRRVIIPRNGNFPDHMPENLLEDAIRPGPAVLGVITEKSAAAGATITEVAENSAAAKAGLKAGDVITKVNDTKISEPQDLFETIGKLQPGDEVTVLYLRDKKEQKATAKLQPRDSAADTMRGRRFRSPRMLDDEPRVFQMPRGFDDLFNPNAQAKLGLQVQDREANDGATVQSVENGSAAEKAGFKTGDVILSIDGQPVKSAREVVAGYRGAKDKSSIGFSIRRNGKTETLTVKVPRKLRSENL
ncbi:PDZ domain-containing protein [Chitinophaga rhizosphaerae]|uniref:PDZ domain-containing protein n=1 Tax=Chitinophaga rhizosphaerae TaxID=1864947 RepID=UPI000F80AF4F|nr:PDZ domain-containing protein [Chitinophaga rhizosphaerae]